MTVTPGITRPFKARSTDRLYWGSGGFIDVGYLKYCYSDDEITKRTIPIYKPWNDRFRIRDKRKK